MKSCYGCMTVSEVTADSVHVAGSWMQMVLEPLDQMNSPALSR